MEPKGGRMFTGECVYRVAQVNFNISCKVAMCPLADMEFFSYTEFWLSITFRPSKNNKKQTNKLRGP
jgi:hypothetical protein